MMKKLISYCLLQLFDIDDIHKGHSMFAECLHGDSGISAQWRQ